MMPANEFLKVFKDRSELVHDDGRVEIFEEGQVKKDAVDRYAKIVEALTDNFLDNIIDECRKSPLKSKDLKISASHSKIIDGLVSSVTSEVGRALVGLSVLQLAVKAIQPSQNIRLHKGGRSTYNFSWKEGISMRSLDKNFITPKLRSQNLLKLNADGFMMTRSLAENYPYSPLYKANLRGARQEWLALVEEVELGNIDPMLGLKYLLHRLIEAAEGFESLATETFKTLGIYFKKHQKFNSLEAISLIERHINDSDYAARLMEIAMHSLYQAIKDTGAFTGLDLSPLSQMRSANKKHGNVADIELSEEGNIVVAWDAKYGKPYLRDEIEELADKLHDQPNARVVGFVTSDAPERLDELRERIEEIQSIFDVDLQVIKFNDWVNRQFESAEKESVNAKTLASSWLLAYTESLAQKRRSIAPIDEPCQAWLKDLQKLLKED